MSTARLLLCTLSVLTSFAAPFDTYAGVWGERGHPRQVLVRGSLAYAADGRGVAVYDISVPAAIHAVHIESRQAETFDAAWIGDRELVTATAVGVERFLVADDGKLGFTGVLRTDEPVSLIAAGSTWGAAASRREVTFFVSTAQGLRRTSLLTMLPGDVIAMTAVGEYLYVSIEKRGTYVYRPPSTQQIAFLPQTANAFALAGDVLWGTAPQGGIAAFDVEDPREPRRISISAVETQFDDVAAAGSRVYARSLAGAVEIFNATSPAAPKRITSISDDAESIAAAPGMLLSSHPGTPLRIFDAEGFVAGELPDYNGPVSGVWTDGSLAYAVDPPYLRVIEVSKTGEPRELSAILVDDIQDRIRVKNGLAVLYGSALVNIIDVSDPLHPRHIGTWDTQGTPPSNAAIADGTIIEANAHSGLHVVDYSDPAHAVQIGGRIWHYYDMAAADDVIYALMDGYFLVLQIVDGHVIVDRKTETVHTGTHIEISPPNAAMPEYVLTRSATGVRVYDVRADRFDTVLVAEILFENPGVIATGDGVAYVAASGTLHQIDLTSLSATDTGLPVTAAMQISVAGEKVVVADRYRLRVFGPDTASPVPPPDPPPPPRRRAVSH